jgi:5-methylcytosine-specific restriction endonuclease McrA
MKEYVLARYHRIRSSYIELKGGKCVSCGSTDRLEFDHIDPDTKLYAIGKLWSRNKGEVDAEVDKCQLLCYDCHLVKTMGH